MRRSDALGLDLVDALAAFAASPEPRRAHVTRIAAVARAIFERDGVVEVNVAHVGGAVQGALNRALLPIEDGERVAGLVRMMEAADVGGFRCHETPSEDDVVVFLETLLPRRADASNTVAMLAEALVVELVAAAGAPLWRRRKTDDDVCTTMALLARLDGEVAVFARTADLLGSSSAHRVFVNGYLVAHAASPALVQRMLRADLGAWTWAAPVDRAHVIALCRRLRRGERR